MEKRGEKRERERKRIPSCISFSSFFQANAPVEEEASDALFYTPLYSSEGIGQVYKQPTTKEKVESTVSIFIF
jgi:hypothetical protein